MKKVDEVNGCSLQPVVKWAGGKEKELKYILPNVPKLQRYFEPFVGGGAVFMAIDAREYYINDLSTELIDLYRFIAGEGDAEAFFRYAAAINVSWGEARTFFVKHSSQLRNLFGQLRSGALTREYLSREVGAFIGENRAAVESLVSSGFNDDAGALLQEMKRVIVDKMWRMRKLEGEHGTLPDADLDDNLEGAVKGALYMYYRRLYNNQPMAVMQPGRHAALFLFIRNYCYSGMFRYNSAGDFNVPYGGIAYNSKTMDKKLEYYRSEMLKKRMKSTHIYNDDFLTFLHMVKPGEEDFVFLDPPYDSEFSTYAQNEFTRDDQRRLADYLIDECRAKWMVVIKNTDYIYSLYNRPGINIRRFDKKYLVSFMNRNDKKVTHLLITNY